VLAMHCETQQRSLPRLLSEARTLNAPTTGLRIQRAMNLPSRSRRVNISSASPLWVSEIDLNNVLFGVGGLLHANRCRLVAQAV
jgi:hypothetical protein